MATSADVARAAAQPAGKVGTDETLSAPFRDDVPATLSDSEHVDPTAQAHGMRGKDPNYIPGAPATAAHPPPVDTATGAAMEALPTGLAGGVKYGDVTGPKATGRAKVDPGSNEARSTS